MCCNWFAYQYIAALSWQAYSSMSNLHYVIMHQYFLKASEPLWYSSLSYSCGKFTCRFWVILQSCKLLSYYTSFNSLCETWITCINNIYFNGLDSSGIRHSLGNFDKSQYKCFLVIRHVTPESFYMPAQACFINLDLCNASFLPHHFF